VSVGAFQEIRIHTSTFAPEFGRMRGGQISLITRSGTNMLSGSNFESFRHESMDAADWFMNNRALEDPRLCQHNFGGVLGGLLQRNRLFYFASYEGLQLVQPQSRIVPVLPGESRNGAIAPP
jgi:hypothetical protein